MMAQECMNCGKELFSGQRFCRHCGTPTDILGEENTPTRRMPPEMGTRARRGPADTAPPPRPETSPVWGPPPNYYQPPPAPQPYSQQQYSPHAYPPYAQPRKGSAWGWIIALVGIGLFSAVILAFLIIGRPGRGPARQAVAERPDTPTISEDGAIVTARDTTITQSYPISPGGKFSLETISGNVSVTGWDESRAEVKVVKRGGSAEDRKKVKITPTVDATTVSLKTSPPRGSSNVDVDYEIKLPRNMAKVVINGASTNINLSGLDAGTIAIQTASGSIQLTDVDGDLSVNSQSGEIELNKPTGYIKANSVSGSINITDANGIVQARSTSGDVSVVFEFIGAGKPLEFESVSGDIDIGLSGDINADLDAETVSGDINLDDSFGVQVRRKTPGQEAQGKIGTGGQPLRVSTVSGDIQVRQR